MDNNITIPISYFIAMIAFIIHLLGFCFYLFWKWHKTIERCDYWKKQENKEYFRRLRDEARRE